MPDSTLLINDVGHACPDNAEGRLHPILFLYRALGVTEQNKGQAVALRKALVRLGRIGTDADDRRACLFEGFIAVSEAAHFRRAARRIVLRIEKQDNGTPAKQIGKMNGVTSTSTC